METKKIEIEIPEGKKAEWINGVLTLVDESQEDNRPVTERIKTFEDARSELITNVEEFLERAAKLKGFLYNRKDYMKFNGIEIKPGMVLVSSTETKYIVFPAKDFLATITYGEDISAYSCWFTLEHTLSSKDIVKVLDAPKNRITDGKVLWQKPKEVVLTMDEIAKKFGYPVEQIKIKK